MPPVVDYDHIRAFRDPTFNQVLRNALRAQGCIVMRLPGSESTAAKLTASVVASSSFARSHIKTEAERARSPVWVGALTHRELPGGGEVLRQMHSAAKYVMRQLCPEVFDGEGTPIDIDLVDTDTGTPATGPLPDTSSDVVARMYSADMTHPDNVALPRVDEGLFLLLACDTEAGVQVLDGAGAWADVPLGPGYMALVPGYALQRTSEAAPGGVLHATPFRVNPKSLMPRHPSLLLSLSVRVRPGGHLRVARGGLVSGAALRHEFAARHPNGVYAEMDPSRASSPPADDESGAGGGGGASASAQAQAQVQVQMKQEAAHRSGSVLATNPAGPLQPPHQVPQQAHQAAAGAVAVKQESQTFQFTSQPLPQQPKPQLRQRQPQAQQGRPGGAAGPSAAVAPAAAAPAPQQQAAGGEGAAGGDPDDHGYARPAKRARRSGAKVAAAGGSAAAPAPQQAAAAAQAGPGPGAGAGGQQGAGPAAAGGGGAAQPVPNTNGQRTRSTAKRARRGTTSQPATVQPSTRRMRSSARRTGGVPATGDKQDGQAGAAGAAQDTGGGAVARVLQELNGPRAGSGARSGGQKVGGSGSGKRARAAVQGAAAVGPVAGRAEAARKRKRDV